MALAFPEPQRSHSAWEIVTVNAIWSASLPVDSAPPYQQCEVEIVPKRPHLPSSSSSSSSPSSVSSSASTCSS
eukprot:198007-Pyramimonas_sp.AAC.1